MGGAQDEPTLLPRLSFRLGTAARQIVRIEIQCGVGQRWAWSRERRQMQNAGGNDQGHETHKATHQHTFRRSPFFHRYPVLMTVSSSDPCIMVLVWACVLHPPSSSSSSSSSIFLHLHPPAMCLFISPLLVFTPLIMMLSSHAHGAMATDTLRWAPHYSILYIVGNRFPLDTPGSMAHHVAPSMPTSRDLEHRSI